MAEDIQRTPNVTELLDAKIASGKESLRQNRLLFYSNLFFEYLDAIGIRIVYVFACFTYFLVGITMVLAFSFAIFLLGGAAIGIVNVIGQGVKAILPHHYILFIWVPISLIFIVIYVIVVFKFLKKLFRKGYLKNPFSTYLRNYKFKSKDVKRELAWEELIKIGKDIKKWKTEKREFLKKWKMEKREFILSHEEQLKKPEEIQSPETKECPMCAETIKAKAIICRFCSHKFESESNSVNVETQ